MTDAGVHDIRDKLVGEAFSWSMLWTKQERGRRRGAEASMPTRLAQAPVQQTPAFGRSKEKRHLATIVAGTRGSQGQVSGYNRLTDGTEATMRKWGRMWQENASTGYGR